MLEPYDTVGIEFGIFRIEDSTRIVVDGLCKLESFWKQFFNLGIELHNLEERVQILNVQSPGINNEKMPNFFTAQKKNHSIECVESRCGQICTKLDIERG